MATIQRKPSKFLQQLTKHVSICWAVEERCLTEICVGHEEDYRVKITNACLLKSLKVNANI